jgi:Tfp pilus assembly protein PilV
MRKRTSGLTLVEVLIAALILSAITTAVASLLISGFKLGGKRTALSYALIAAQNDVERIRSSASKGREVGDSLYDETINNYSLRIARTVLQTTEDDPMMQTDSLRLHEITIAVIRTADEDTLARYRFVQGCIPHD